MSGLVYVFALPTLVHYKKLQLQGKLTQRKKYFIYTIIGLGVSNLLAQFFI